MCHNSPVYHTETFKLFISKSKTLFSQNIVSVVFLPPSSIRSGENLKICRHCLKNFVKNGRVRLQYCSLALLGQKREKPLAKFFLRFDVRPRYVRVH